MVSMPEPVQHKEQMESQQHNNQKWQHRMLKQERFQTKHQVNRCMERMQFNRKLVGRL